MKNILYLIILTLISFNCYGNDKIYITITGDSYSETRSTASRLASSQGMKIVGQNYVIDQNKKWHVIFQLRSLN
jgi:hypothetical protein